MIFQLILSDENLEYYGRVPELPCENGPQVEVFEFEEEDWELLNADFIDAVNDLCKTLLDYGDVDFFDAQQCRLLLAWLQARMLQPLDERLQVLYTKLSEFASRAIELETGVVVEL